MNLKRILIIFIALALGSCVSISHKKEVSTENNEDIEYYIKLGRSYEKSGEHEKAIETYKEAIRIKPDFAQAYSSLGFSYSQLGKHEEAIEALKQAIRLKPDDAIAHYNLGIFYDKLGKHEEAIEALKQAIRIAPDSARAHYALGILSDKLGKHEEAIEALKQAIRLKPDDAMAHYNLGIFYDKLGKYEEAIEALKQAIRIAPDFARAYYNLAIAYGRSGKHEEATAAFKQAIRINPYFQLQSGKKVVVLSINKMSLHINGESALVLKYQTDISFNNRDPLYLEVESVWVVFQEFADRYGVKAAVIEVSEPPNSFGFGRFMGWGWKKHEDGMWHETGENDQALIPKYDNDQGPLTKEQKEEFYKEMGIILPGTTKDDVREVFGILEPDIWYTLEGQEVWYFKVPSEPNIYFRDDVVEKVEYGRKPPMKL